MNEQSVPKAKAAPTPITPKLHFHSTAVLTEHDGAAHPLANGLVIETGSVKVTDYKSDSNRPIVASFIPADESAVYHGAGAVTGPAGGLYTWEFTWGNVPAFGCDGTLRFADVPPPRMAGTGTTTDFTISVVEPGTNPCGDDSAGK